MIKLFYPVRLVLHWLAIKHMWSGSVVCSCLVIYNPIGSLKHAGQLVLCQSRLSGMDKPGWREREREREIHNCSCSVCCQDILLPLCLYTLAHKSFKYVHFYETHINHARTQKRAFPQWQWLPSVRRNMTYHYNSSGSIKRFSWNSFISCRAIQMFCVESYIVLLSASFVFCLAYRRPSPVLTYVLHTVCLMIPCLSEMRRIGNYCCPFVTFLGRLNGAIYLAYPITKTQEQ